MKTGILIIVICMLFSCQSGKEKKETEKQENALKTHVPEDSIKETESKTPIVASKKIKIQVYYTQPYCGGTPPNKEILAELHKKRWYQDSPMRIYSNTADLMIFNFTTNHEGWAEVELPYGTYSIRLDTTMHEQMSHLFNRKCKVVTEKVWKTFTVSDEELSDGDGEWLTVVMDFDCDPCDPTIKMRP